MGYIYINIKIFPKKLQFAAYGQFVLVFRVKLITISYLIRQKGCAKQGYIQEL